MKPVRRSAARVLDRLIAGLDAVGQAVKFDNAPGVFMAVHVERIGSLGDLGPLFSIAHYFEQNGDLMRDPEMIFLRGTDGSYYPTYFRQDGIACAERFSVRLGDDGCLLVMTREQADEARFASIWMANIKAQQLGRDLPDATASHSSSRRRRRPGDATACLAGTRP